MPHFGHMDASLMDPEDAELFRSRLHLRAAKRRFRQGRTTTGISVLYDSFLSALRYYAASPVRMATLDIRAGEDIKDERAIYLALVRSGILSGTPDFDSFTSLVESSVDKEICSYDYVKPLGEVEEALTRLGVMPFDLETLPPEKPDTP